MYLINIPDTISLYDQKLTQSAKTSITVSSFLLLRILIKNLPRWFQLLCCIKISFNLTLINEVKGHGHHHYKPEDVFLTLGKSLLAYLQLIIDAKKLSANNSLQLYI